MKVAVSATGSDLEAQVDPRFGRCQYFVIVETETMVFEAIPNTIAGAMSGAGIQAAQALAKKGVETIITGSVGPNAYQVLSSAGIRIFIGASGTVRGALESFKRGQLREVKALGPGGFGTGSGIGMGRGMDAWTSSSKPQEPISPYLTQQQMSRDQEIILLESQMRELEQQLMRIRK
ncbi:MAG: NifB/NifX family molybdenum-iron cluster-binding protein [Candidatus Bathyarchaeia archaeon]